MEDAQSKWTIVDNLEQWFDDAMVDLVNLGLVIDNKVRVPQGQRLFDLDFWSEEVNCRIINMDETHNDLSITGDMSGSRAMHIADQCASLGHQQGEQSTLVELILELVLKIQQQNVCLLSIHSTFNTHHEDQLYHYPLCHHQCFDHCRY
jgi:hypothetical protein